MAKRQKKVHSIVSFQICIYSYLYFGWDPRPCNTRQVISTHDLSLLYAQIQLTQYLKTIS